MSCAPSGAGSDGGQPLELRRGHPGEQVATLRSPLLPALGEAHLDSLGARLHTQHLGPRAQLGSGAEGRIDQRPGDGSHAPERHVPLSGAPAEHVVEEAAVLAQALLGGVGKGPDQAVRQDDALHQVVGERGARPVAEGRLEDRLPGLVVVDHRAQLGA